MPLAVSADAIQTFRDWQVVFVKYGDWFEARPLELGRTDGQWVEVAERAQGRRPVRRDEQLRRQGRDRQARRHARPLRTCTHARTDSPLLDSSAMARGDRDDRRSPCSGLYNYTRLPIDAVPDITNVQVQINTEAPGYSPLEAEQRVTYLVETAMAGLPRLEETRSISRYGLSQVTVIFEDGTDIYFARQLIAERIQEVKGRLPPGLEPAMGPIATGLGEIFLWTVEATPGATNAEGQPYSGMDLRTIQDWIVRPQLKTVPGVADVNTHRRLHEAVPRDAASRQADGATACRSATSSRRWRATTPTSAPATSSAAASST